MSTNVDKCHPNAHVLTMANIISVDSICDTPFWNSSSSWNTDHPALSPCFCSTALVWLPSLFLILCFPYTLYDYINAKHVSIPWNRLNVFKLFTALTLVILGLVHSVYSIGLYVDWFQRSSITIDIAEIIGTIVSLFTYCLLATFLHLQRLHGFGNCGPIWFYLLLKIVCTALSISTLIQFDQFKSKVERVLIYAELAIEILLFLLCSFSDHVELHQVKHFNEAELSSNSKPKTHEKHQKIVCPKERASFPSKLTFWWFNSLALLGFRRPLKIDDLWQVRTADEGTGLFNRFNRFWKHKSFVNNDQSSKEQPLANVISILFRQFGSYFLFPCVGRFITDNIQLVNPIVVKYVISYVSDPSEPFWHGIFYTMVFVITNVVSSFTSAYQQHRMGILAMRIRATLLSAIYRKSLALAVHSKRDYTTGEIINLMSVDCQLFPWLNFMWTCPFQIGIALWLLWAELGVSVVGGLILMLLFIPLQSFIASWIKGIQEKQMTLKDSRMKAISELLNGMKVLKLYAWEQAFIENIQRIRLQELRYIRRSGIVYTICSIMSLGSPFMVTCLTFWLYMVIEPKSQLTAQKAFVSVALFNMIRYPLSHIPTGITNLIMTSIAVKRISKFLNSDEIVSFVDRKVDNSNSVVLSNASFNWEQSPNSESFSLSNINLTIPKGSLVAVVGSVGSGKSSLLYALLGEMYKHSGSVNISGDQRLAYVSQQVWIQNASLRENILFGHEFDLKKYHRVIEACALRTDLNMLPGGDQTEIGEKGINLSGGQKQRISIARACYSDSNLYLFDDPLSAVDSHVGKHIFTEVFDSKSGILKNKTRILVTNALYMLPGVDQIVLLKNGTIDAVGSHKSLMRNNPEFRELILNYTNSSSEQIEDEVKSAKQIDFPNENEIQVFRERQQSTISSTSRNREKSFSESSKILDHQSQLVEDEETKTGQVTLAIYTNFFRALSPFWSCCIVIGYFSMISTVTGSNVWLSVWTSNPDGDSSFYLLVYFAIGMTYVVLICFGWNSIVHGTLNASKTLHWGLLSSIVHAPMHFFDTTPLGRIVNRFSKDIDVLDMNVSNTIRIVMNTSFTIVATLFVVSFQNPLFLAVVIPFIAMYIFIQRFYVSSSRQLKRLESVTRSPIFTHFSESIQGVSTIKAFSATERFVQESDKRVDENQRCIYPSVVSLCWLQVRLEFMGNCLVFFASLLAVLSRTNEDDGNSFADGGSSTGLSLSYALSITLYLNNFVRNFAELENNIVSVERISEYVNVEPEAAWNTEADKEVALNWPEDGIIRFEQYGTRYRPGLDLVLKRIDFSTGRAEKIGIVGRTGAGKSSLTLALFRIIEASNGKILMDGIDIASLGLQTLRSRITIIPQDPVLFCGTIRSNLDPFSIYSDEQLWHILELSHLKSFVASLALGLSHPVSEGGENLSVGQRQLICLARALLRRTKVLVLDEATAAVDLETDSLIQSTIRRQFAHCTVLTIAHRLNTILDSDRVMVLDAGNVAEMDTPANLLADEQSIFYSLAKDAGIVL